MSRDTRSSRCSETDQIVVYADGIAMPEGTARVDYGCKGDTRIFSVVTTLVGPLTYKWSLDGITPPKELLGSDSSYGYTYDENTHRLYVRVEGATCSVQSTISVRGKICKDCVEQCALVTGNVPAGEIHYLIDNKGVKYPVEGSVVTECRKSSKANTKAAIAIKRAILQAAKCKVPNLTVGVFYNQANDTCISINISHSPISFSSIQIGRENYLLNMSKC